MLQDSGFFANVSTMKCIPFRSLYTVTNSYTNNMQVLNYTTKPLEQLLNTNKLILEGASYDPRTIRGARDSAWYRDTQLMGIIIAMASSLNGSCSSQIITHYDRTVPKPFTSFSWSSNSLSCTGIGAPFIPYTRLNSNFGNYKNMGTSIFHDPAMIFTVTEDILSTLLANLTFSIMATINSWNQTINVTQFPCQNFYAFSNPNNLLLPYFLTLIIVLLFLIIGTLALYENGIPAIDGGFVLILSTTTGSCRLQQAAAGNCLGGDADNTALERLMDLEIQYGELVDMKVEVEGCVIRRAGFGVKDEVAPVKKGEKYGTVIDN